MFDADDPSIRDLVDLQRAARRTAGVGWRTMGGALQFDIEGISGEFAGFSGRNDVSRNYPSGVDGPPVAPPCSSNVIVPDPAPPRGFRANDAENNMLEHLVSQLSTEFPVGPDGTNPVQGRVRMLSEQEPCESCNPTIRQFQRMYPNLEVEVSYVLPYPPVQRNRPTL
ncbi:deaminase domain-containing protein [Nocardia jinanensis]|uniref:deaminase domain-containing protein n=1 Tax=Nocardia jinanensis TaxID=382504 RepID=UPI003987F13E